MLPYVKSVFALLLLSPALSAQRIQPISRPSPTERVVGRVDLIRISAQESSMTVSELFLLDEDPRHADKNRVFPFTILIPSAAIIRECIVENDEGEAVKGTLSPGRAAGEFVIELPYHPSGTKAQVIYELPYSGLMDFEVRPSVTQERLAVMLPKSMRFEAQTKHFEAVESDRAVNVYVVKRVKAFQSFKFRLQGHGDLPKSAEPTNTEAQSFPKSPETSKQSPKFSRRVWYLIGLALIVGIGIAIWHRGRATVDPRRAPILEEPADLLREKLFELETARLKGEISSDVYQKRQAEIRASIKRLRQS